MYIIHTHIYMRIYDIYTHTQKKKGNQRYSLMQAEISSVSVLQQMCGSDLTGRKTERCHSLAIPGWSARLMRTLSDSFFNSVEVVIEVHMESISTSNSCAMRKEDSPFLPLYLVGIKLN